MKRNLKLSGRFALTSVAAAALCFATPWASALGLGPVGCQVVARRSPAGRDRCHQLERRGTGEPAHPGGAARVVSRGERRLQPGIAQHAGHARPAARWAPVRSPRQRPWCPGAVRRRDSRDVVGDGAAWCASTRCCSDPPATIRATAPPTPAATSTATGPTTSPVMSGAPAEPTNIPSAAARAASKRQTREAARLAVRERLAAARAERGRQCAEPQSRCCRCAGTERCRSRVRRRRIPGRCGRHAFKDRLAHPRPASRSIRCSLRCSVPTRTPSWADNMNRLKSGAVLSVPSAEAAQGIGNDAARQTITAQSADFGAYRQRLAGAPMATQSETAFAASRAARCRHRWRTARRPLRPHPTSSRSAKAHRPARQPAPKPWWPGSASSRRPARAWPS